MFPPFERSLAAQEGALRARHIKFKCPGEACRVYAQSNKKIEFVCLKPECNHNFEAQSANINNGRGCPFCSSPPKQLCGKEECLVCWSKSLASKADDLAARCLEYCGSEDAKTVFVNQNRKTLYVCTKPGCGHDFEAVPYSINAGSGCPFCASQKLCGKEECLVCWSKSLASKADDLAARCLEYCGSEDAKTVFVNQNRKTLYVCTKPGCGHDFEAVPYSINAGSGCPFCASQKLCGKEECLVCWRKSVASKEGDLAARYLKYSGSEDARTVFINQNRKMLFTCTTRECDHDFEASPNSINAGSGCPFCSLPPKQLCGGDCSVCLKKSLASRDLAARGIKFIGEDASRVFASSNAKFMWQCLDPVCGSTWRAMANSVCRKKPSGCPGCARHKTERMVSEYIKSVWGQGDPLRADWCRGPTGRHLPYDIYVKIDFMGIIFEVDGEQHFSPVAHFNRGGKSYETILEGDRYKQNRAVENGRHVVRMHQEDVLFGRIDWQAAIHHAVRNCLASDRPLLQFIAADISCYEKHKM